VTDPNKLRPHELAHEVLQDTAMDQALDWLIALQCPQAGQQAEFEAWLARDPAHVNAFAKAQAAWGGAPVHTAAVALAAPRTPSARRWACAAHSGRRQRCAPAHHPRRSGP